MYQSYYVSIGEDGGITIVGLIRDNVVREAMAACRDYPDQPVYVMTWINGEKRYLNPSGDLSPKRENWNDK